MRRIMVMRRDGWGSLNIAYGKLRVVWIEESILSLSPISILGHGERAFTKSLILDFLYPSARDTRIGPLSR